MNVTAVTAVLAILLAVAAIAMASFVAPNRNDFDRSCDVRGGISVTVYGGRICIVSER